MAQKSHVHQKDVGTYLFCVLDITYLRVLYLSVSFYFIYQSIIHITLLV